MIQWFCKLCLQDKAWYSVHMEYWKKKSNHRLQSRAGTKENKNQLCDLALPNQLKIDAKEILMQLTKPFYHFYFEALSFCRSVDCDILYILFNINS